MSNRYSVLLENPIISSPKEQKTSPVEPKNRPIPVEKVKRDDLPIVEKTEPEIQLQINKSGATKVQEIRVTLPLPNDLLSFLDQMERDIFLRRSPKFRSKQRLTKNSIARAWLSVLRQLTININNIQDETDLLRRLRNAIDEFHNI